MTLEEGVEKVGLELFDDHLRIGLLGWDYGCTLPIKEQKYQDTSSIQNRNRNEYSQIDSFLCILSEQSGILIVRLGT